MNKEHEQELKNEIEHIFESGTNEVRILEMVKAFVKKRYLSTGIIDRNGNEIFVGDVVKLHDDWDNTSTPYTTYIVKRSPLMVYFEVLEQSEKSKKIYRYRKGEDANLGDWVYKYLEVVPPPL